jgi:hypothetical protein
MLSTATDSLHADRHEWVNFAARHQNYQAINQMKTGIPKTTATHPWPGSEYCPVVYNYMWGLGTLKFPERVYSEKQ